MRKFRASMEPFWDFKISKYIEYLMHVSSKYFTSSVLRSLTSTDGWSSCVLLAYIMPWINKASTHHCEGLAHETTACHATTNLKFGSCTALLTSSPRLKHRNLSLSRLRLGLRLHLHDDFWRRRQRVRTILTTFYHMHHYTMQLLGIWSSVSYYSCIVNDLLLTWMSGTPRLSSLAPTSLTQPIGTLRGEKSQTTADIECSFTNCDNLSLAKPVKRLKGIFRALRTCEINKKMVEDVNGITKACM